jgi:hypothetical protein
VLVSVKETEIDSPFLSTDRLSCTEDFGKRRHPSRLSLFN